MTREELWESLAAAYKTGDWIVVSILADRFNDLNLPEVADTVRWTAVRKKVEFNVHSFYQWQCLCGEHRSRERTLPILIYELLRRRKAMLADLLPEGVPQ